MFKGGTLTTTTTAQAEENRYTFETKTHASGGFAKIVKGRDNWLERNIAVKVLDTLVTKFEAEDQERFRREARILARLSHPNIPAIYDVRFSSKSFLILFEFVEGMNLSQVIEEEGPVDMGEVRRWFGAITSALTHAHDNNVVHRDIKPENIIISPDRQTAYLVDFGIALSGEDAKKITRSGLVIGTPGYMSPEHQAGEDVDWRTDIYSLGVSLYEALAGKRIPVGDYEQLNVQNETIPPEIDDLIQDCLRPREQRSDSPKTFASRLVGALQPQRPLSEVLAHGKLHELANSLAELSAEQFVQLPEGQRALILLKVSDIVASDDPNLSLAAEQLLELLVRCGLLLPNEQYRQIVSPAIRWGFERKMNGWVGIRRIQRALEEAAFSSREESHGVLSEEFIRFIDDVNDLDSRADWFLHAVRQILQPLLANPACTSWASQLARAMESVNTAQRGRQTGYRDSAPKEGNGHKAT